eukprot:CAMPEP_0115281640 /NCGR_PEP_ID=MMETSP0270-20121206/59427_1 /TAXON_ID=71861 /ORGANISM="Scrippsiella trochoidea, Strain CCMP3099" /LENGTH=113 /DNA_ID=CAMNT_0002698453 /DNA_START=166 /DNA_END=507 /DNA_ORIENTATION=-
MTQPPIVDALSVIVTAARRLFSRLVSVHSLQANYADIVRARCFEEHGRASTPDQLELAPARVPTTRYCGKIAIPPHEHVQDDLEDAAAAAQGTEECEGHIQTQAQVRCHHREH